jgi:hypothetical protein
MTGSLTLIPTRLAGLLTAVAISVGTLSGCGSAGTPACTDAPVFLVDNTTFVTMPAKSPHPWNERDGVVLSATPVPADLGDYSWARFAPVSGATFFATFLASPGSERTPQAWRLWSQPVPIDKGVLLPAVWPGYLSEGTPAPIKAAGGTYEMGVAYLDGPALETASVVAIYVTTIQVTAGTGQWTFSDAPTCPAH